MKCRMLEIFVTGRLSSIGTLIAPISWVPSSPRLLVTSGDWCGGDIVRLCSSVRLSATFFQSTGGVELPILGFRITIENMLHVVGAITYKM